MEPFKALARGVTDIIHKLRQRPSPVFSQRTPTYTANYQKVDGWWIAWVDELPGANTQAETLDEAREMLREAVELLLETNDPTGHIVVAPGEKVREELVITH